MRKDEDRSRLAERLSEWVEGKLEGKREAVLILFAGRGWTLTPEQYERITTCKDVAKIIDWLYQAAEYESCERLFR